MVVGRLASITPAEGERFFLRLLLINVRNPKSFTDLRTVNGVLCATFQEEAIKRGLCDEDNVVHACLAEAAEIQLSVALRRLFAAVANHTVNRTPFRVYRKSLAYFQLDHLHEEVPEELNRTKDIVDALDAPIPQEIIAQVQSDKPGCFFIDGPGGTDKTFLYNALYAEVRMEGKIVLPTATSGIATTNIPSRRTVHSRFKIPLDSETSLACDLPKEGSLAALIKQTTLIIGDEASMAKIENVPAHIVSYYQEGNDPISYLSATAFLELEHAAFSPNITESVILTSLNDAVDSINAFLINKFPANYVVYKSFDSMLDDKCAIYPIEFLNQLAPGGMTPHELVLKINSPVILLRNIDPADVLCNGMRLIYKSLRRNVIVCSIATSHRQGELVFVHRVNIRLPSSTKYSIQFERI
ncbi:uncharacterized protein LOC110703670 [Chenopodium quinoa]|uniref:uncharacterized protein LOC110703670 n=1 Tax=Chenopodium quinoa TaxID=63459 RepID=UPI000B799BA7|nr:uncharacterized protein LOC110703670 [Chenopodium quinoa]